MVEFKTLFKAVAYSLLPFPPLQASESSIFICFESNYCFSCYFVFPGPLISHYMETGSPEVQVRFIESSLLCACVLSVPTKHAEIK